MFDQIVLDPSSGAPLYRQLAISITELIHSKVIAPGYRLPPTRELAGQLGLNRTTVSAAYSLLEEQGLVRGHVGRGSFVTEPSPMISGAVNWDAILPRHDRSETGSLQSVEIPFATSRPADGAFPLVQFRRLAREVIDGPETRDILQLGSPLGYGPLRKYLFDRALEEGVARAGDDLIITNGCQQALDLLTRLLAASGQRVIIEDPVYHGLLRVIQRAGANIIPAPVGESGVDPDELESLFLRYQPRACVLTPSFQNPTGATINAANRGRIVEAANRHGVVLIENDIYTDLRYQGTRLATLKQTDAGGNVILLRSYSKIAFPGLRVGWVIAPRPVISCLAEAKQTTDLHSDQLAQAVLLRFAESGELDKHLERTRRDGVQRLRAIRNACEKYLPEGTHFTRPEGGMNLWVELPEPLDARGLLAKAQELGVNFLPGNLFSVERRFSRCLRLSFGGLSPEAIERGVRILGSLASRELTSAAQNRFEPASALV